MKPYSGEGFSGTFALTLCGLNVGEKKFASLINSNKKKEHSESEDAEGLEHRLDSCLFSKARLSFARLRSLNLFTAR